MHNVGHICRSIKCVCDTDFDTHITGQQQQKNIQSSAFTNLKKKKNNARNFIAHLFDLFTKYAEFVYDLN